MNKPLATTVIPGSVSLSFAQGIVDFETFKLADHPRSAGVQAGARIAISYQFLLMLFALSATASRSNTTPPFTAISYYEIQMYFNVVGRTVG